LQVLAETEVSECQQNVFMRFVLFRSLCVFLLKLQKMLFFRCLAEIVLLVHSAKKVTGYQENNVENLEQIICRT
jgi:hypothetical protein